MRSLFYSAVLSASMTAFANDAEVNVPFFKAICLPEKSTGFNWSNGKWVQANFGPGKQILVQKIDFIALESKPLVERPLSCGAEETKSYGAMTVSRGCYLVKDVGSETFMFTAEMCTETLIGNKLKSIRCKELTFHPDGAFIQRPWHDDIDQHPKDDYKDSLSITVGHCSSLAD